MSQATDTLQPCHQALQDYFGDTTECPQLCLVFHWRTPSVPIDDNLQIGVGWGFVHAQIQCVCMNLHLQCAQKSVCMYDTCDSDNHSYTTLWPANSFSLHTLRTDIFSKSTLTSSVYLHLSSGKKIYQAWEYC